MGLNLCDWCAADCRHERNPNEIVVKCGAFKPPATNADRIRSMSDEELAKWMFSPGICIRDFADVKCDGVSCKECRIDWLRQPAEED